MAGFFLERPNQCFPKQFAFASSSFPDSFVNALPLHGEPPLCKTSLSLPPLVKDTPEDVPLSNVNHLLPDLWKVSAEQALLQLETERFIPACAREIERYFKTQGFQKPSCLRMPQVSTLSQAAGIQDI